MNSHSILLPPDTIINKQMFLFLHCLLKSIFIFDTYNRNKKNEKIDEFIQIIKNKYNIELRREYSKENFENIIKFIRTQNIVYGGEILENILLRLFCSIMTIPQNETINKYIYNNLLDINALKNKTKERQNQEISFIQNFINYDKIYPYELKNKDAFFHPFTIIKTDFEYFLALMYKLKIDSAKINIGSKRMKFNDITYNLYNYSLKNSEKKEEINIIENCIIEFEKNINKISDKYLKNEENRNDIIFYFFFTLFVNYQIINSRLMSYSKNNKNSNEYARVPYEYNFRESIMKEKYAILISSPMRQDDRIKIISMAENDLRELGMIELGKTVVFNPNIKTINYNKNRLNSWYLFYLNNGSKIFENDNIEEINFYKNFFKDDVDDYLCDIIQKFKNLKTINLSSNRLGSGVSKFLSKLKLLYRKKKSKLEKLYLNSCFLDKSSLYELCELLKNKYCKLKCLYLNLNYINDNQAEQLLKAIKNNHSLKEIYLGRNFIGNSSTDNINKAISRPHGSLKILYLNQNEIKNNDNLLRIVSRTKIIYSKEEDKKNIIINFDKNKTLKNLDISNNNVNIKNKQQILLFKNIINDTSLTCLDYSVILDNFERPEKLKGEHYLEFKNEIRKLIQNLNNIKKQRNKIFEFIEEMKHIENKYDNIFEQYIDKKDLNFSLMEALGDKNIFSVYEENIESLISYELLETIGKTKEDLLDDDIYNFVNNLIKYMLLYKVNGGLINQWLKGINKCLIIV